MRELGDQPSGFQRETWYPDELFDDVTPDHRIARGVPLAAGRFPLAAGP